MENIKSENLYTPNCIRTFSGIYINVFEPTLEMICIEDIAHALSHQCRFGGHLSEFYSVAQHSMLCTDLVEDNFKLQTLLHDASEAYLLDIPSPIKQGLSDYKKIEHNLMLLIAEKFNFKYPLDKEVKEVDSHLLNWEWNTLMLKNNTHPQINCLSSLNAKNEFLKKFNTIIHKNTIVHHEI